MADGLSRGLQAVLDLPVVNPVPQPQPQNIGQSDISRGLQAVLDLPRVSEEPPVQQAPQAPAPPPPPAFTPSFEIPQPTPQPVPTPTPTPVPVDPVALLFPQQVQPPAVDQSVLAPPEEPQVTEPDLPLGEAVIRSGKRAFGGLAEGAAGTLTLAQKPGRAIRDLAFRAIEAAGGPDLQQAAKKQDKGTRNAFDFLERVGEDITTRNPPSESIQGKVFDPKNPRWWIERGGEAAFQLVGQLGLAAATGGQSVAAQFAAFAAPTVIQVTGQTFNDARDSWQEKGLEREEAETLASGEAIIAGAVSAAIEKLPFAAQIQKRIPSLPGLVSSKLLQSLPARVAGASIAEGVTEAAQDTLVTIIQAVARQEPEALEGLGEQALASGALGFLVGGPAGLRGGRRADVQPQVEQEAAQPPPAAPEAAEADQIVPGLDDAVARVIERSRIPVEPAVEAEAPAQPEAAPDVDEETGALEDTPRTRFRQAVELVPEIQSLLDGEAGISAAMEIARDPQKRQDVLSSLQLAVAADASDLEVAQVILEALVPESAAAGKIPEVQPRPAEVFEESPDDLQSLSDELNLIGTAEADELAARVGTQADELRKVQDDIETRTTDSTLKLEAESPRVEINRRIAEGEDINKFVRGLKARAEKMISESEIDLDEPLRVRRRTAVEERITVEEGQEIGREVRRPRFRTREGTGAEVRRLNRSLKKTLPGTNAVVDGEGAIVTYPNGNRMRVAFVQEINPDQFPGGERILRLEVADLLQKTPNEVTQDELQEHAPEGAFASLSDQVRITLTEGPTGDFSQVAEVVDTDDILLIAGEASRGTINFELFRAGFQNILDEQGRKEVVESFGSEEKAATAFEELLLAGEDHPVLSQIKNFFKAIVDAFIPGAKARGRRTLGRLATGRETRRAEGRAPAAVPAAVPAEARFKPRAKKKLPPPIKRRPRGRPDLAKSSTTPEGRAFEDDIDELLISRGLPDILPDAVVFKAADEAMAKDKDGERERLLKSAISGNFFTSPVDVVIAKRLVAEDATRAALSDDPDVVRTAQALTIANRQMGTFQSRGFRLRQDPALSPEERMRGLIVESLVTPSRKVIREIANLRESGDIDRVNAKLESELENIKLLKKRLKAAGLDLETLMSETQAETTGVINGSLADLDQMVADAIGQGSSTLDGRRAIKKHKKQVEALREKLTEAHGKAPKVDAAINSYKNQIAELKKQLRDVDEDFLNRSLDRFDKTRKRLEDQLSDADPDIKEQIEAVKKWRDEELGKLRKKLAEISPAKLNATIQRGMDRIQTLRDKIRERGILNEDLQLLIDENAKIIREMQTKLTAMNRQARNANSRIDRQFNRIMGLRDKLAKGEDTLVSQSKWEAGLRMISTGKSSKTDIAIEVWKAGILGAFATNVRNAVGNAANGFYIITVKKWSEVAVNLIVQDPDSAQIGELPAYYAGLMPGMCRGAANALKAWNTENPVLADEVGVTGRTRAESKGPAIPGKLGRGIRYPFRGLTANDEFSKSILGEMEASAIAWRAGKKMGMKGDDLAAFIADESGDATSQSWFLAYAGAEKGTFQNEFATERGRKLNRFIIDTQLGEFVVPFRRTPINIEKVAISRTPYGALLLLARVGKAGYIKINPKAGGDWTYTKSAFVEESSRQVAAWITVLALIPLMLPDDDDEFKRPFLTGNNLPFSKTTKGERSVRSVTHPARSFRFGDTWHYYGGIEPFATQVSTIVDLFNALQNASLKDVEDITAELFGKAIEAVNDTPYLRGIAELTNLFQSRINPVDYLRRFVTSWVPNLQRNTARSTDPFVRETKFQGSGDGFWHRQGQKALYEVWPSARFAPPPRVDHWGREIKRGAGGISSTFAFRLFGADAKPVLRDPATRLNVALLSWNEANPEDQMWPRVPNPQFTRNKQKLVMTDVQYNKWLRDSGQRSLRILSQKQIDPLNPGRSQIEDIVGVIGRTLDREKKKFLTRELKKAE